MSRTLWASSMLARLFDHVAFSQGLVQRQRLADYFAILQEWSLERQSADRFRLGRQKCRRLVQPRQHAYHTLLPSNLVYAAQHPELTVRKPAADREHSRRFQALSFFFRRSSIRVSIWPFALSRWCE
jgi:hypothetical protein